MDLSRDEDFRKRLSIEEVSLHPPSINFLNSSQIICDFYGGSIVDDDGYYVLEINARTGDFGQKLNFKAYEHNYKALPLADGGFAVFANDELKKFSNQFVPGPSYATPRERAGEYFDRWITDTAPGGRTILLYSHQPGKEQGKWSWLRTTDLVPIRSIQGPSVKTLRASDTAGIFDGVSGSELYPPGEANALCTRCSAYFLTDELLFLYTAESYVIRTIAGKEQGVGNLRVSASDFTRAAQASRFAYLTGHYEGSGFPIQTHFDSITAKIMVRDWSTNKVVTEIDVNEPAGNPSAGLSQMALALSPDGKQLAVLLHHTLTLYSLP